MGQTIPEIKKMLEAADADQLAVLERSLAADTRKGVKSALAQARKRIEAEKEEAQRLLSMVAFQQEIADSRNAEIIIGLDEVGRGPLAGPLAIGGVVLPKDVVIAGLNDSKQVAPAKRESVAEEIKRAALAWTVVYIQPEEIDACGMTACLLTAFRRAVKNVEEAGYVPDLILLDGNPLHMDPREVNVIKGDAKCASIAAASIIAKVDRDALMTKLAETYPQYGFDQNKGYGSAGHIEAIKKHGLSPVHRQSFCTAFDQPTLF